jgi:DNA-binding GntR family transcriptional regulator
MAPVRPVLHRLSSSSETVRNAPKHELLVKWSGSGAFVAKNSDATLFTELVR